MMYGTLHDNLPLPILAMDIQQGLVISQLTEFLFFPNILIYDCALGIVW